MLLNVCSLHKICNEFKLVHTCCTNNFTGTYRVIQLDIHYYRTKKENLIFVLNISTFNHLLQIQSEILYR